jgi:hypothetical protein
MVFWMLYSGPIYFFLTLAGLTIIEVGGFTEFGVGITADFTGSLISSPPPILSHEMPDHG